MRCRQLSKKIGSCAPGSAFGLEYQGLSPNRGVARIERQAWTQSVQGAVATCQSLLPTLIRSLPVPGLTATKNDFGF